MKWFLVLYRTIVVLIFYLFTLFKIKTSKFERRTDRHMHTRTDGHRQTQSCQMVGCWFERTRLLSDLDKVTDTRCPNPSRSVFSCVQCRWLCTTSLLSVNPSSTAPLCPTSARLFRSITHQEHADDRATSQNLSRTGRGEFFLFHWCAPSSIVPEPRGMGKPTRARSFAMVSIDG